jgi:aminoglycoside phosphotransferase (APT) family kinase protein
MAEMTDPVVGLEPAVVEGWILGLGLGAQAPLGFAPVGNFQSNLTYRVTDAAGARWTLRRPPVGGLLASAQRRRNGQRSHRTPVLARAGPFQAIEPDSLRTAHRAANRKERAE